MNQVALVGSLTDDIELRYTQSGLAVANFTVANFTVAVSRKERHNGQWHDVTDGFFRCTAWRQVADNAAASFKKGSRVMVSGRLVQRTFETEGQRRSTVETQVQHLAADMQFAAVEIKRAQVGDSPTTAEQIW